MRRTCTPVLFGFLMFASICTNARADPIRLTFDDVAPGIYLSNLYGQFGVHLISGASFPDGGAAGITEVSIVASEDAVSAPNILRPRPPTFELFTDIIGFFFNQEETLLTDSLSMTIVGADSSPEPWSIRLIGLGGYLDTFVGTGNHVFSVTRRTNDILGFEFLGTGSEGLDNLTVGDLTPVPEPGTLALVGLGLAGLLRRMRPHWRS